jgi:type I restriction enzyme, S subunit
MRFGLGEHIVESLISVFEKYSKVDKAIVFGSRAKGNYRPDSDIDIAIKGAELTEKDVLNIHVKFSELDLPFKIDLLNYHTIKEPELKAHIDRVGIELYSRWKKIPLSKTTKFIVDNRGKTAPTASSGIPLIATNCIDNDNLYPKFENIRYISQETYDTWFRSHPEPGDIILTLKGSQNGAVCLVPDPVGFVIAQDMVALRANEEIIDSHFLFAALRSAEIQSEIKNLDVSGVIPHLKKSDFDKLMLPYPDMGTQKKIGSVYYSLSRKIDLLHRQNRTLEELAETLFRQWFVEEAEENWEEKSLPEIAEYLNGLALQKFPAKGIDFLPVIKIREMKQGISENTDRCSKDIPNQYIVRNGDVLFSWSGSLEVSLWSGVDGALNQHLFKVSSTIYPKWFYYLATKYHLNDFKTIAESKSTTMGHIQREHLQQAKVSIPSEEVFSEYDSRIAPLIQKQIENNSQIHLLTKTRDALLPKLMNGEVKVNLN